MKGHFVAALCAGMTVQISASARADSIAPGVDKFQITAAEMSACGSDAIELCSSAYPDQQKLLYCMKVNRVNLSATCRPGSGPDVAARHACSPSGRWLLLAPLAGTMSRNSAHSALWFLRGTWRRPLQPEDRLKSTRSTGRWPRRC